MENIEARTDALFTAIHRVIEQLYAPGSVVKPHWQTVHRHAPSTALLLSYWLPEIIQTIATATRYPVDLYPPQPLDPADVPVTTGLRCAATILSALADKIDATPETTALPWSDIANDLRESLDTIRPALLALFAEWEWSMAPNKPEITPNLIETR